MNDVQHLEIDLARQTLRVHDVAGEVREYPVSTARNGPVSAWTECTPVAGIASPRDRCRLCAGHGLRRAPADRGDLVTDTGRAHPGRDWILTRILWLEGLEPGFNQGGSCDTYARYIYIHGTPASTPLGRPGSRGCIRMGNADLIALFDRVVVGTPVDIHT